MAKEINLLQEQLQESERTILLKKYLGILSPIVLVVFSVLVIGVFVFSIMQSVKAKEMETKIKNTESNIQSLSESESYLRGIKIKLTSVNKIIKEQIDYAKIVSEIQETTPPDINFTNLSLTGDKLVEISYKAPNSDVLKNLVNGILDETSGGRYFENVKLKNLVYSRDGYYLLTLNFHVK